MKETSENEHFQRARPPSESGDQTRFMGIYLQMRPLLYALVSKECRKTGIYRPDLQISTFFLKAYRSVLPDISLPILKDLYKIHVDV